MVKGNEQVEVAAADGAAGHDNRGSVEHATAARVRTAARLTRAAGSEVVAIRQKRGVAVDDISSLQRALDHCERRVGEVAEAYGKRPGVAQRLTRVVRLAAVCAQNVVCVGVVDGAVEVGERRVLKNHLLQLGVAEQKPAAAALRAIHRGELHWLRHRANDLQGAPSDLQLGARLENHHAPSRDHKRGAGRHCERPVHDVRAGPGRDANRKVA